MNVMNIMKFAYSVEISLHSLMNSLMRLNESNEFINELNEWLMKFIKMTFCPKKYFILLAIQLRFSEFASKSTATFNYSYYQKQTAEGYATLVPVLPMGCVHLKFMSIE